MSASSFQVNTNFWPDGKLTVVDPPKLFAIRLEEHDANIRPIAAIKASFFIFYDFDKIKQKI
jgi:hypothetical protein